MIVQEVAYEGRRQRRRKRVLVPYVFSVFFLITLNFFLPRTLPGDPISAMLVSGASTSSSAYVQDDETRQALSRYYGLDQPLLVQYGHYLGGLAQGDLGVSIRYRTSSIRSASADRATPRSWLR